MYNAIQFKPLTPTQESVFSFSCFTPVPNNPLRGIGTPTLGFLCYVLRTYIYPFNTDATQIQCIIKHIAPTRNH